MVKLNRAQRRALKSVFDRSEVAPGSFGTNRVIHDDMPDATYRDFRKTVLPGPDCVMVRWGSMWLGIEADGYTHS